MKIGREARSSGRIRMEAPVEYSPFGLLVPRLENITLPARCVDVSEDDRGIGFVTCHPLFTGRRLRLAKSGVARNAIVKWVRTAPEGYRVGASFV